MSTDELQLRDIEQALKQADRAMDYARLCVDAYAGARYRSVWTTWLLCAPETTAEVRAAIETRARLSAVRSGDATEEQRAEINNALEVIDAAKAASLPTTQRIRQFLALVAQATPEI